MSASGVSGALSAPISKFTSALIVAPLGKTWASRHVHKIVHAVSLDLRGNRKWNMFGRWFSNSHLLKSDFPSDGLRGMRSCPPLPRSLMAHTTRVLHCSE